MDDVFITSLDSTTLMQDLFRPETWTLLNVQIYPLTICLNSIFYLENRGVITMYRHFMMDCFNPTITILIQIQSIHLFCHL